MKPAVIVCKRIAGRGFTLVEMIAVIAILGVLSALGAQVLGRPIVALTSTAAQGRFVDMLDLAVDRVSRDVRSAAPRSLRVLDSTRLSLDRTETTLEQSGQEGREQSRRIGYVCGNGALRRVVDPAPRASGSPLRAEGQLVASDVLACSFHLDRDTFSKRPVVTMRFELGPGGDSSERYSLVAQARPWLEP